MDKLIALLFPLVMFSCTEQVTEINDLETDSTNNTENVKEAVENEIENEIEVDASKVLPVGKLKDFSGEATYTDTVFSVKIDRVLLDQTTVSLFITEDLELVLEKISEKNGTTKKLLDIGEFNDTYFETSYQMIDIDPENDNGKELFLKWNTSDANNGVESGFEMNRSGILVFSFSDMTVPLDLVYTDEYSEYQASEDFDSNDGEAHGKMAEDSDWSRCSVISKVVSILGMINITESEVDKEGDCDAEPFQIGSYIYDSKIKKFALKK